MEVYRRIEEFPRYSVTNYGRVFNITTGREMVLTEVTGGALCVGLRRDGCQYRRQVKTLVARAFIEGESETFDTPVSLDGDKANLHVSNIVWRPRWFAWEHTYQFNNPKDWYVAGPLRDVISGSTYRSILEASIKTGTLCREIRLSMYNGTRVFPTGQIFEYVKDI